MNDTTRKLNTIVFFWDNGRSSCRLHDKTWPEALAIAKDFGFEERRWFKPWTWLNGHTIFN
jgi:hypothetical protein